MALQDSGIFIASSLIADTPEKDKENAEPIASRQRSGDGPSRSARKSLLGRRRSSVGRRLSGFGGGGFDPNADQTKLTSMYSSIIKLNSENKITRDKCWGLPLIDYMDKMILGEAGQAGGSKVNFQKASCTLDASVKIYSHRVDSTHMSSYSLLENLTRTDGKSDKGSGATVGSSERSARLGVHETLKTAEQLNQSEMEREFAVDPMFHKMSKIFDEAGSKGMLLNNLNVSNGCKVSFDSEVETAPPSPEALRETVFRVAGDEGGLNSSVEDGGVGEDGIGGGSSPGSETAVDPLKEVDVAVGEKDKGEEWMVDISGLRSDLFALCSDLTTLPLCPQLQEFRDLIADLENGPEDPDTTRSASGNGRDQDSYSDSDSDGGGGGGFDDIPGGDDAASFNGAEIGGGNGDFENDGSPNVAGGTPDDEDPFGADTGECWTETQGFNEGGRRLSLGGLSLLGGAEGAGVDGSSGGVDGGGMMWAGQTGPANLQDRLCGDLKIVNDDYAFYDKNALAMSAASSNNWAGASHWKFGRIKKKPKRTESGVGANGDGKTEEDGGAEGGNARRGRGARKPPAIDFDAPPVSDSALAPPSRPTRSRGGKKHSNPTVLSEDYLKRALKAAEDGTSNYALPENARFTPKDLGELFLRPGAFTKRWAAVDGGLGGQVGAGPVDARDLQGFLDSGGGGDDDDLIFADANDGYGGGDDFDADDDDDDDDDDSGGFHFAGGFDAGHGDDDEDGRAGQVGIGADGVIVDNFEGKALLSADRRVEKINVNYARKAKRVDVRRLKGDLWRKIDAFAVTADRDADVVDVVDYDREEEKRMKNEDDGQQVDGQEENGPEQGKPPVEVVDMTFSDIVQDVASTEEQSGVTVPFYFICLLHLANEKGLKLEGRDDLLDFSVARDSAEDGL